MRTDSRTIFNRTGGQMPEARLEQGVDKLLVARVLAYLFGSGALLLLVTLALDGDSQRDPQALLAVGAIAFICALVLVVLYDSVPLGALLAGPAVGTALVSVTIYYAGPAASAAYALYYAWAVIAAAMFFRVSVLALHGTFAVLCYLGVMLARDVPGNTLGLQVAMLAGTVIAVSAVMSAVAGHLRGMLLSLDEASRTDHLTGLLNRRAFSELVDAEILRARRSGHSLGIVLLDLDGLKEYNDRHGHLAGDDALRRLGAELGRATRAIDHLGRIGGDEFAIVAPETGSAGTLAMAERVRRAIEIEFSEREAITASCGVAAFPEHASTQVELIAAADAAMYEAKAQGRNRAVASTSRPTPRTPERSGSAA